MLRLKRDSSYVLVGSRESPREMHLSPSLNALTSAATASSNADKATKNLLRNRCMIYSSIFFFVLGILYARYFRYSLFRPIWYVEGSQQWEEETRSKLAFDYLHSIGMGSIGRLNNSTIFVNSSSDVDATLCVVIPSAMRSKEYVFRSIAALTMSTINSNSLVRGTVLAMGDNKLCERLEEFSAASKFQCVRREQAVATTRNPNLLKVIEQTKQTHPDEQLAWLYRERFDYALAVDWCTRNHQDGYVLVMQDDGILSQDGIMRTLDAVAELDGTQPDWKVLRLYSSDFWSGWETRDIPVLVTCAILGGILTVLLFSSFMFDFLVLLLEPVSSVILAVLKRDASGLQRARSSTSLATVVSASSGTSGSTPPTTCMAKLKTSVFWLLKRTILCCGSSRRTLYFAYGFLWFLLGPLIVGKQHMPVIGTRTSGGVVHVPMREPGTVAYVYPRQFAEQLVARLVYIEAMQEVPVDLFVNDLIADGDGFELLPNVVDHIGFVSSSEAKNNWRLMARSALYLHPHHVRSGSFHRSSGSIF